MDDIDRAFGERLREVRKRRKLTLQQLGERANVDYKFCGRLELKKSAPSLSTARRLAHALDVSLDRLVGNLLGPTTAGVIRDVAVSSYGRSSPLFRVVASIRHWSEEDLVQLEGMIKALRKVQTASRGRARKRQK